MNGGLAIIGGGLAGAAAACRVAQAGRPVMLLEREPGPADKICGEFLSNGAQLHLHRLGVDPERLGGAPITHLRLVRDAALVRSRLPFRGVGLSRRVLDEALLARAAEFGAEIRRGHAAGLAQDAAARELEVAGLGTISPSTVFLATGKHDLRGLRRSTRAPPEELVGFKTYFALSPAQRAELAGHIEVMMFPDGYAGLQLVEAGRANLCLLTARSRLQQVGGTWPALLADLQARCTHLRRRLEGATDLLERPLSIFRVPYGFVHEPAPGQPDHIFRLGDQMGVIPSFAGDGMAIALHSAALAAEAHLAGAGAAAYHRRIGSDIGRQIGRAEALYRFARWTPGQAIMMATARAWPGLLRLAASATRVPLASLLLAAR